MERLKKFSCSSDLTVMPLIIGVSPVGLRVDQNGQALGSSDFGASTGAAAAVTVASTFV